MIAVLVAALLVAQAPTDTVFTADGGRIAGTVLEDSPTAGVTIQTPDGAVRRIERNQVVRIEFADGSVSTPSRAAPAQPAPAPAADLSVRPATALSGPMDTVYLSPSGRVRGTVMEENAATGVKIRRLDGSIQNYPIDEVARIEYADGTVSTPRAPKPAAAAPAPAPAPKATEAPLDTVYFLGGGRVRGTVIEEHPRTGVKVRLLDGTVQTYSRDELVRIEYADGTVSRRKTPAPAAAPATTPPPSPPPAAAPATPAAPPPKDDLKQQPVPLYVSLGVGGTLLGGSVEQGKLMSSVLSEGQAHFSSELGLRLSPGFAIGGYADIGAGDPSSSVREECRADGVDCIGVTGRYGLLIRHTWDPLTDRPKWLSLGTGWEFASVEEDHRDGSTNNDRLRYEGRELVRIGGGVDFRSNPVLGLGLYGSISWGEFDKLKTPGLTQSISTVSHTTAQIGLRLTLFP